MRRSVIPERFRRAVILHVIKNMLRSADSLTPLILGIHGPSGYGKTFQCEQVLQELGVKPFLISGGELESPKAGRPAELIRAKYIEASRSIYEGSTQSAVLMINDIDVGVGSFGNLYQYTVNRQNVFAALMHLVDYPRMVEDVPTFRVPVIVTGNDFTKLYEPFVRAGRMTAFEWKPTREEITDIVSAIYPELASKDCKRLVEQFPGEPLAFFTALRSGIVDEQLYRFIQTNGLHRTIQDIRAGHDLDFDITIGVDELVRFGRLLVTSGTFVNHLARRP